jgi:hypothetical protein
MGLNIVTPLTPIDTDNDLASYERVTFTFRDDVAGAETVALLVYQKTDDSVPPNIDPTKQVLLSVLQVVTTGVVGQQYTLTADLPECGYQVDATWVPPGQTPPAIDLASIAGGIHNLDAALGSNDCPVVDGQGGPEGVTRTQGYWKTHPDAWPLDTLTLGSVTYTKAQLLRIFNTPVRGNGAIALAHQLIAAKLNLAAGAHPTQSTIDAMNAADVLLGSGDLLAGFSLRTSQTSALTGRLDAFNQSGDS